MRKKLTIAGISLIILAILLTTSAFLLSRFIDPNKYKGKISQYVYAKTGQVLVINGNLEWAFFPWIGLKANNLNYYNPPAFTPKIFVAAKEMDIKIKLIPLISGKIQVRNITLDRVTLNLIKNKSGEYNWHLLVKNSSKNTTSNASSSSSNTALTHLTIASLKIKHGKLTWYDQIKNTQIRLNQLNINSKAIQFGHPFPLTMQFDFSNGKDAKNLSLSLDTNINLSPDNQHYSFQNLLIEGKYFHNESPASFGARGYISADLDQQTLASNLNFELEKLKGKLDVHATDIRKKLHADATLSINKFNLNETLEHLGKPIALNKNALEEVSLSSKINIQDSNFLFNQLQIKMDKTKIFGNVIISKNNGIHFNLIADQINIDDYLSDKKSSENQVKVKENEGKHPDSPWKMEGRLKISTLNTHKIKLTNFNSALNMHNDIIQLGPLSANLYQGNLKGSVTIDQHQKNKTAIYIKQVASNINTGEFLVELFDSKKLSGSSNINADLSAVLDEKTSFLSALNGKIDFSMLNGSMQGIDIIYQLSRAHAFIKHLPSPKAEDTKQTQFATLTANASLENGLMNTDNLAINSSYLKVNGKGYTNLVTKEIHYRLNALAQPRLANENMQIGEEITTYQIPIKVSGKLNKPSVNLDFVELAKNFYSKKIQKPIAEQLDKNIKHLKNNLEEKVNDKLKELSPTKFLKNLIKSKEASGETTSNEKSFDLK